MLEFQNVSFSYGEKPVLQNLSFKLEKGEILAIMGPSGSGKSTLLNLAAGLRRPSDGNILCRAARPAYVFQEPRLLPSLTVRDNICVVLSHVPDAEERIQAALEAVSLTEAQLLYPDVLSGGMKSRASLSRALAYGGDLYLLDEPFAALDEELRQSLSARVRTFLQEIGASALFVTHQRAEAQAFADRILELKFE